MMIFDFQLQRKDHVRKLLRPNVITEGFQGGKVNRINEESVRGESHAREGENLSYLTYFSLGRITPEFTAGSKI